MKYSFAISNLFFGTLLLVVISCSSSEDTPSVNPTETDITSKIEIIWAKTFGGSLEDEAKDITITSNGNYAIIGNTESVDGDITDGSGTQDLWLILVNPSGELLWNKTFGGDNDDRAESVATTNDGGFIVSGYSRSSNGAVSKNAGSYDHWIVKLSSTGEIQWETSLGFKGDDRATDAFQTKDGGFITTGYLDVETYEGPNEVKTNPTSSSLRSSKNRHGVGEFWVHKLEPSGKVEWEKFYGGTSNEQAHEIIEVTDGYVIVGTTESKDFDVSQNNGSYDYWIVKIDIQGQIVWEKSYGGSEIDTAYGIIETENNNYIIVGDSRSSNGDKKEGFGNADIWILKIDNNGSLLDQKSIGGTGFDSANDILIANDGDFIISGTSRSTDNFLPQNKGLGDLLVAKINRETLTPVWKNSFGGSQFDFGYKVVQDKNTGNITVVGDTESTDKNIPRNRGKKDALVINFKEK